MTQVLAPAKFFIPKVLKKKLLMSIKSSGLKAGLGVAGVVVRCVFICPGSLQLYFSNNNTPPGSQNLTDFQ